MVAVARAMDMTDSKQKTEAVKAVREAVATLKDEETVAAAKEFLKKHGG